MESRNPQKENWIHLINRMLEQVDTRTVRRAYYLLLGFLGASVSSLDTEQ